MNASKPPATAGQAGSGQPAKKRYQWKPWKIAAVAFAGLLLVGGGALALTAGSAEPTTKSGSQDFGGTGPGGTGGPETARSPHRRRHRNRHPGQLRDRPGGPAHRRQQLVAGPAPGRGSASS